MDNLGISFVILVILHGSYHFVHRLFVSFRASFEGNTENGISLPVVLPFSPPFTSLSSLIFIRRSLARS
jgi:hypothetical protein